MSSAALLEVRNLGKRFTGRQGREPLPWIIQGLSFSVGEGEFLTIVGPSGSGKTTLLNMIAQIYSATTGEVCFRNEVFAVGERRALKPGLGCQIGYVT